MTGQEFAFNPRLTKLEKIYIQFFGVPISGLRIRLRRIFAELDGNPKKILDAGCGRGIFSLELAKKFSQAMILGVDIDREQILINQAIAQAAHLNNIRFQEGDVADLAFHEEFDWVLSVDNLEHIENDQQALACLAQAIVPGGRLILHVPGYERRWVFFKFKENFDVPGHYRPGYRLDDLQSMVQTAGLSICKAFYTYGWLETISNNFSYLITGAQAKRKWLYALLFPLLNGIAWCGRNSRPHRGAGVLIIATKPETA